MRAILIDPVKQEVTVTDCDPNKLDNIYKLIHADCFDIVTIQQQQRLGATENYREIMFVDDMGLLKDSNYFFSVPNHYPQYLAGYALVMGCDRAGNTVATRLEPEDLQVQWLGELVRATK